LQQFVLSKVSAQNQVPKQAIIISPPVPTPTTEPTPTDVPVSKSDISIVVLNGTDTIGLAKKIADKLTAAGFSIAKTGNADNRTGTLIQYPTGQKNGADQLIDALKPDYLNIESEATDSSDFTIILGQ
jgi:hypothetical protein